MEFKWFQFDKEISFPSSFVSSSSSGYGYFTEQALRAGLLDTRGEMRRFGFMPLMPPPSMQLMPRPMQLMPPMPPPPPMQLMPPMPLPSMQLMPPPPMQLMSQPIQLMLPPPMLPPIPPMHPMPQMTALQREIEKERIREEIMWEIEQRKILEKEVRREIEMEQLLASRTEKSQRGTEVRAKEEFTEKQQTPLHIQKLQFGSKSNTERDITKPISSPQKIEQQRSKNLSSFSEVIPLNQTVIGTKRKVTADAGTKKQPRQIPNDWSCALCRVSSTSEADLNEHLQGKRHKIKAAALVASTTRSKTCGKYKISASNKQDDGTSSTAKTVNFQLDGKLHKVQDKDGFLWCYLCKVKTNGAIAMTSHLGGRKHTALMGNLEKKCEKQAAEGTTLEQEIKVDKRYVTTESVIKDSSKKEYNYGRKDTEKDLKKPDRKVTVKDLVNSTTIDIPSKEKVKHEGNSNLNLQLK